MLGGQSWPPHGSGRAVDGAGSRQKGGSGHDCPPHNDSARAAGALWSALKRVAHFAAELLRHLADESAYRRSLERDGARPSPNEWRRFSDARYRARFTRPKCC